MKRHQLERYVAEGGTLVMSFFCGIVDEHDHIRLGGYPAPFRKMLGLRIEEFAPYAPEHCNSIRADDGSHYQCTLWSDIIDLQGAAAIAQYDSEFYAGRPTITRHAFGQGTTYYVGTQPEPAGMAWLLNHVCEDARVRPAYAVPEGVEVVQRHGETTSLL
jgi:beta-galactosidase